MRIYASVLLVNMRMIRGGVYACTSSAYAYVYTFTPKVWKVSTRSLYCGRAATCRMTKYALAHEHIN